MDQHYLLTIEHSTAQTRKMVCTGCVATGFTERYVCACIYIYNPLLSGYYDYDNTINRLYIALSSSRIEVCRVAISAHSVQL